LSSRSTFLFLSTNNIGGAEKRFAGLWHSINAKTNLVDYYLVGSKELLCALQRQKGFDTIAGHPKIIEYDLSGNFRTFRRAVISFVKSYTKKNDILHFIGDHPLQFFDQRKIVYSITQSSFQNLNVTGKIGQLGGVAFSNIVDVLDPSIYNSTRRLFFYKRNKIFRTSNSYCDVDLFSPLPFEQKKDWFVFLGRFEAMKQVKELLTVIPAMHQALNGIAVNDLRFFIFGHGSLEGSLDQILSQSNYNKLPVTIGYTDKPQEILKQSKFFFSLQLHNNYPSRSLIEAMAAGNIPIVTDVGQTRWLAKPEFSFYVPEHFSEGEMLKAVSDIYRQPKETLAEKSRLARQLVVNEHTIDKMGDYYLSLYNKIC
jgi:glycosyltransferase involved in cell wall biosynthesis